MYKSFLRFMHCYSHTKAKIFQQWQGCFFSVWYPVDHIGQFPVHYFIGGFGGVMPSFSYSTVLSSIASHGYVVAGTWPLVADGGSNFSMEAHQDNIKWVSDCHRLTHWIQYMYGRNQPLQRRCQYIFVKTNETIFSFSVWNHQKWILSS